MAINTFNFNPPAGIEDPVSFPDPVSEEETREQMQRLHNQTRDKVNEIVSHLNSLFIPSDEYINALIAAYVDSLDGDGGSY